MTVIIQSRHAVNMLIAERLLLTDAGTAYAVQQAGSTLRDVEGQSPIVDDWASLIDLEPTGRNHLMAFILPLFSAKGPNDADIVVRSHALDPVLLDLEARDTYYMVYFSTDQGTLQRIKSAAHRWGNRLPHNANSQQVKTWARKNTVLQWSDWDFSNGGIDYLPEPDSEAVRAMIPPPPASIQLAAASAPAASSTHNAPTHAALGQMLVNSPAVPGPARDTTGYGFMGTRTPARTTVPTNPYQGATPYNLHQGILPTNAYPVVQHALPGAQEAAGQVALTSAVSSTQALPIRPSLSIPVNAGDEYLMGYFNWLAFLEAFADYYARMGNEAGVQVMRELQRQAGKGE